MRTTMLVHWSLLDALCRQVLDALADVDHYPEFIPGIDSVQLMGQRESPSRPRSGVSRSARLPGRPGEAVDYHARRR